MDDRTPPGASWPVSLRTVLTALRDDDEVTLDLGSAGLLHVRWSPQVQDEAPADAAGTLPPLPVRREQVLREIARGLPATVIADTYQLPLTEVAEELQALRRRYGVDSTAAAVVAARRVGDLPAE
ncbi:hypothetical protein [Kineococcus sp. SYSU DK003]|uniref:hypothetical protein n=1 Tax=Kineococcus sp. SYSU DK003 TaxID=3383124 RepID=UPI003D7D67C0